MKPIWHSSHSCSRGWVEERKGVCECVCVAARGVRGPYQSKISLRALSNDKLVPLFL